MINVLVFRGIIHASGDVLGKYLADNYCPTIEEEHQEGCPDHLAQHYPDMLGAVVHRFLQPLVINQLMITSQPAHQF